MTDESAMPSARKRLMVVLSPYLVEAQVYEPSFLALWHHELRWARTVRALAPAGFAGTFATHPLALALLAAAGSGFSLAPYNTRWDYLFAEVGDRRRDRAHISVVRPRSYGSCRSATSCPLLFSSPASLAGGYCGEIRTLMSTRVAG